MTPGQQAAETIIGWVVARDVDEVAEGLALLRLRPDPEGIAATSHFVWAHS